MLKVEFINGTTESMTHFHTPRIYSAYAATPGEEKSITFFHIPKTGGVYTDNRLESLFELVNLSRIGKKYTEAPYNYRSVGHRHASLSIKRLNQDDSESVWEGNQYLSFNNREVLLTDHVKDSNTIYSSIRNPFDLLVSYFCHNAGTIYDINTLSEYKDDILEDGISHLRFYPDGKYNPGHVKYSANSSVSDLPEKDRERALFWSQQEKFDQFFTIEGRKYGITFPTGWRYLNFDLELDSFSEFIEKFCDEDYPWPFPAFKKFMFYNTFLDSGESLSTKTIRYENIDKCLADIFLEFGEKYSPTGRENSSVFRYGKMKRKIPYQDYYNERLISLVRKKCERELEAFNYDFDFSSRESFVDMSKIRYSPKTDEFKII